MKIRSGLVSNSSSSSFVLTKKPPRLCNYVKIDGKTARNVSKRMGLKGLCGPTQTLYLTQFISDCSSYYNLVIDMGGIYYAHGGHGTPYDSENYVCLDSSSSGDVWIRNEDYEDSSEPSIKETEIIRRRTKRTRFEIIKETILKKSTS